MYIHIYIYICCICVLLYNHCHVQLFCNPINCSPPDSSVHEIFQARYFLLLGIFSTQGWSPCLLDWHVDSLPLSHQGSPYVCVCVCIYIYVYMYICIYVWALYYTYMGFILYIYGLYILNLYVCINLECKSFRIYINFILYIYKFFGIYTYIYLYI